MNQSSNIAVLLETALYYSQRNSNVFCCLLDASKAFDRVHFGRLFNLLERRQLPAPVIRLLFDSYSRHTASALWDGARSHPFSTKNGVKQGGVLSPILFIVYFDELLISLKDAGVGCYLGPNFVGGLGYADDITLVAPSLTALHEMLHTCKSFADEYNVLFNAPIKFPI